jgi:hypothetical protein
VTRRGRSDREGGGAPRREREDLERAREALRREIGGRPWCRGVGIGRCGSRLALRVNVDPDALGDDDVPRCFHGHAVEVVYLSGYAPREDAPERS